MEETDYEDEGRESTPPEKPTSDQNKCEDIIIAKKYIDITELNEDNNQEIFFDKKYDQ